MLQIPQTVLEKWAFDLFQNEEAEAGLYPAFEQFLLGAYRRARHDEAVDSAFGLGSPFAEEFSQFLTTIPCPDFLAEEAQSDFAYYREMIDEGFPHSFLLRYVGERREGLKREEAINRVFSDMDLEDQFEIVYDYLLAHGKSEHTATDYDSLHENKNYEANISSFTNVKASHQSPPRFGPAIDTQKRGLAVLSADASARRPYRFAPCLASLRRTPRRGVPTALPQVLRACCKTLRNRSDSFGYEKCYAISRDNPKNRSKPFVTKLFGERGGGRIRTAEYRFCKPAP